MRIIGCHDKTVAGMSVPNVDARESATYTMLALFLCLYGLRQAVLRPLRAPDAHLPGTLTQHSLLLY